MVKHSSRILLSQTALKNNLNFIRKKIGPGPRISSVVKANAYGHGTETFVKLAEKCGVDHFAVSSAHEAEEIIAVKKPETDVMVMGILYLDDVPWVLENDIEFFVFDYHRLEQFVAIAKRENRKARIHLELETGTNRTGLNPEDLSQAISFIKKHKKHVELVGVCTHLAGAESSANQFRIERQVAIFQKAKAEFKKKNLLPKYFHIACSAVALAYPELTMDMVSIGIAQYGFWPSPEIYYQHLGQTDKKRDTPLKRVLTWKTDVMDIKQVEKDAFIGYGTSFQAYRDMKIAVLPLGYSNGYSRQLSNKGMVLIKGRKAPIVGLVNMNLFMVDISHIEDVEIGDEVVLIGKQNHNTLTVSSFANTANQLNNEMLARLPSAIPREVVR